MTTKCVFAASIFLFVWQAFAMEREMHPYDPFHCDDEETDLIASDQPRRKKNQKPPVLRYYSEKNFEANVKIVGAVTVSPMLPFVPALAVPRQLKNKKRTAPIKKVLEAAKIYAEGEALIDYARSRRNKKFEKSAKFLEEEFAKFSWDYPQINFKTYVDRLDEYAHMEITFKDSWVINSSKPTLDALYYYLFANDGAKFKKDANFQDFKTSTRAL